MVWIKRCVVYFVQSETLWVVISHLLYLCLSLHWFHNAFHFPLRTRTRWSWCQASFWISPGVSRKTPATLELLPRILHYFYEIVFFLLLLGLSTHYQRWPLRKSRPRIKNCQLWFWPTARRELVFDLSRNPWEKGENPRIRFRNEVQIWFIFIVSSRRRVKSQGPPFITVCTIKWRIYNNFNISRLSIVPNIDGRANNGEEIRSQ